MDYEKAYYKLFNAITDIIEKLKTAQTEAEEIILHEEGTEQEKPPAQVVRLYRPELKKDH